MHLSQIIKYVSSFLTVSFPGEFCNYNLCANFIDDGTGSSQRVTNIMPPDIYYIYIYIYIYNKKPIDRSSSLSGYKITNMFFCLDWKFISLSDDLSITLTPVGDTWFQIICTITETAKSIEKRHPDHERKQVVDERVQSLVRQHSPRQMCHRLEFVVDKELWRHHYETCGVKNIVQLGKLTNQMIELGYKLRKRRNPSTRETRWSVSEGRH